MLKAGINVGTPIVYAPNVVELAGGRIGGTSVDDRAACAVMLELARATREIFTLPTIHLVFSVLEEFNLRGAVTAAQVLQPDICIQLDLALATDTPDMGHRGDVRLGAGPVMSMFSFHGRGTLNGCIPHPALVQLFQGTADARTDQPAALRPYRRAHRNLLRAARRQGRGLHRHGLSRPATPIRRSRSATSPISRA